MNFRSLPPPSLSPSLPSLPSLPLSFPPSLPLSLPPSLPQVRESEAEFDSLCQLCASCKAEVAAIKELLEGKEQELSTIVTAVQVATAQVSL